MDYTKMLKRAWSIVWSYRALWIFGALLALTTTNGFWLFNNANQNENQVMRNSIWFTQDAHIYFPGEGVRIDLSTPGEPVIQLDPDLRELQEVMNGQFFEQVVGNIWAILYTAIVLLVIFIVLRAIFRYTSEAALIRMVDESENSGEKLTFRQGLRLGWSRIAWQLFMIDLVVYLPVLLTFILLFAVAILPLMLWLSGNVAAGVFGTIISFGLLLLFGMLVFAVIVALSPLLPLFRRACAVERLGVTASIRRGFKLISKNFAEVIVVWLIWIGTRLAWMIALIPIFLLLLPVTVLFILLGVLVAGIPVAALGGLLSLVMQGAAPWVISILILLPLFFLVAFAPLYFLSGLVEIFKSSTWTLAYRQLRALEKPAEAALPSPSQTGIQPAPAAG